MRGVVLALDTWLDPNHQVPSPVYLDACDWEAFVDWLAQDPSRAQKLRDGTWRVCLFKAQLNRHYGSNGQRNRRLTELGIELDKANLHQSDEMFIAEVLRVYFHSDSTARPQAELLALARRRAGNGEVAIISQHWAFWRIPLVDTYFVPGHPLKGHDDLPAQFDFLRDFDIHRELAQAVRHRLDTVPYGDTVLAAIIALRDHIRRMSGLQQDGRPLMEQAFSTDGTRLRLNPLTDPNPRGSQQNEQRGFQELYCGVMTGLRNPLVHEGADSAFAKTRYPNKKTLFKYLSFLSILFERADGPLP